jgi:hypothetical protein
VRILALGHLPPVLSEGFALVRVLKGSPIRFDEPQELARVVARERLLEDRPKLLLETLEVEDERVLSASVRDATAPVM